MAFNELPCWRDERLASGLDWYRRVAVGEVPGKHRIARRIAVEVDLEGEEEALWAELDRRTPEFLDLWQAVRDGRATLDDRPRRRPDLVDLTVALARRMLAHCNFCRWNCRVDRSAPGVKHGTCQLAEESRVGSWFHHRGEELVFRGRGGSGTIFFTSCNMRCHFCQNGDISTDKHNGTPASPRQVALAAWELAEEGCHNVNWVGGEATIHLHTIVEAVSLLEASVLRPHRRELVPLGRAKADSWLPYGHQRGLEELPVPLLWNSNFFMSPETMKILRILMDSWLPDFKFGPGPCGVKLSRTPWYWETVTGNLALIQEWGESAVIRHLVMPGHVECCTFPVLQWIADHAPDMPLNVMDQYHPDNACDPSSPKFDPKHLPLARRPTRQEILQAYERARDLDLCFESVTFERSRFP